MNKAQGVPCLVASRLYMGSIRRYLAVSDSPGAQVVRQVRSWCLNFAIPAPRIVFRPLLLMLLALRSVWHFCRRVFYAEPLFKAYCESYGTNVHTDIRLHWVMGNGLIRLGDNVKVDGLCTFSFATRYVDKPRFEVGNNSGISSGCIFVVGKSIRIGNYCRIGGGVSMRDSDGHATEANARKLGDPPKSDDVRPIVIEDNVWIGSRATIGPGVTIGEGSIVSSSSVVVASVRPYTIVAGNPARKVGDVPCSE